MASTRSVSLGQLLSLVPLVAALPGTTQFSKRLPDNAVSLGCYLDNANGRRALEGRSYASDDMTVDTCAAFCQAAKFPLFAVTYGRECFCGDAVSEGNTKVTDQTECSFPCAGDSTQTCGAGNRINLYSLDNVAVRGPATSLPGITSLGCFVDSGSRIFPFKIIDAHDMTAAKCAANCAGYPYFGTQWSRECYCGVDAPTVSAPASECNMPCTGDDNELCGAGMRLNAYKFDAAAVEPTPSPSESSVVPAPTPSAPVVDGFEYQGCYTDNIPQRVLSGKVYVENQMTLAKCAASCKASNYGFFGVTYGTECFCGTTLDSGSAEVPEVQCDMTCSGDHSEQCGSANRLNVYKNPALIQTGSSNPETVGEFKYKSCWTDDVADRSLNAVDWRTDDMTIEKCAERCADYQYFGLEYSRECFCGNELGGQVAPEKECSLLCMGNGTQWCGGPARLNLYSKVVAVPSSSSSVAAPSSSVVVSSSSPVRSSIASSSHPSTVVPSSSVASAPVVSSSQPPVVVVPSSSAIVSSSAAVASSVPPLSSSDVLPSSTPFSSSVAPSSTTPQAPTITVITSCPATPTINMPDLCYYPKLPNPCDRLTLSTFSRYMSTALRSCMSTLTSWGMTANPVATACFPTTTAANPPNPAAASSTMSSVWSCLQTANVLCTLGTACQTSTYSIDAVPSPTPTIGVNLLGQEDSTFDSGSWGNWQRTGFNQHLVPEFTNARSKSGAGSLKIYFPNTNGLSGVLFQQVTGIEAGKVYQFRYWLYHENPAALTGSYQYIYPVGVGTTFEDAQLHQAPAGVWRQRVLSFTATSTFLNIRITVGGNVLDSIGSAAGRNNVYIDDIELVRMA